jgi:hypothetical protein
MGVFGFGNGTFNTPVLVEAADTGPFFHNNSRVTIEEAVSFYTGPEFNSLPSAGAGIGITLAPADVNAVAAFLRTINALENIRSSLDLAERAEGQGLSVAQELLKLSRAELDDAIDDLRGGALTSDPASGSARGGLTAARALIDAALSSPARDVLINQAIARQIEARGDLAN